MKRILGFLARHWMVLGGAAYVIAGLAARAAGYHGEDAVWHVQAASRILDGSFDIYSLRYQPWAAPPQGMAFAYSSLVPLLLAPFVALGRAAGLGAQGIEVLIALPWLITDVLLAWQITALASEWTGDVSPRFRAIAFVLPLVTFIMPLSSAYMGHHESALLLAMVLALRSRSFLAAGAWWGVAICLKQTALFGLLPVAWLVLLDTWRAAGGARTGGGVRRLLAPLVRFFGPIAVLPLAFVAPFWLRWPAETSYSLLGMESHRVLYGINVPTILVAVAGRVARGLQPGLEAFLIRWNSPLLLLFCAGLSLAFVLRHRAALDHAVPGGGQDVPWQRPGLRTGLLAAMGANYAAYFVLGKWTETHYRFMPLLVLLILDLVERPAFPYVYVIFALSATLWSWADPMIGYWRFVTMAVVAVYFLARSLAIAPAPGRSAAGPGAQTAT